MEIRICAVGRVGARLADAAAEYGRRAARYFRLEMVEVREVSGRGRTPGQVRSGEAERLVARVPAGFLRVALTRGGEDWDSTQLARFLERTREDGTAGVCFLLGGANGLDGELIRTSDRRLRLARMTLPHDLARVVLLEQIYRAGTILRGEPYHKGVSE